MDKSSAESAVTNPVLTRNQLLWHKLQNLSNLIVSALFSSITNNSKAHSFIRSIIILLPRILIKTPSKQTTFNNLKIFLPRNRCSYLARIIPPAINHKPLWNRNWKGIQSILFLLPTAHCPNRNLLRTL